jgi:hypothetical protein
MKNKQKHMLASRDSYLTTDGSQIIKGLRYISIM